MSEKLNKLNLAIRYLIDRDYRDYRLVRSLNVFDPEYFRQLLKKADREDLLDTFRDDSDPLWAYFKISRKELSSMVVSPGLWRQLLDPCPLFDTWYYLASYKEMVGSRHPFSHYLLEGWKSNLKPSPFFDPLFYEQSSSWHKGLGNPLIHYLEHGLQQRQDCSLFFSHGWYLDRTPLPEALQRNAIKHYKLYGAAAGKSPVPVFDPDYYKSQIDDLTEDGSDPMLHYICVGERLEIAPNSQFNLNFYRISVQDQLADESPLAHYLSVGVFQKREINRRLAALENKPVISIVIPVYNPKDEFLNNCIRSVLYQSYPHWQLWLVDDFSSAAATRDILAYWSSRDERINCLYNDRNKGISATTQIGADHSSGEYLGFLDHDDELAPECLWSVAEEINRSGAKFIYTDEDLIGDDGSRHAVFHKPGFNRALLYSHTYITHFMVVARGLFDFVGGFNSEYDGAQDYDLVLRLTSRTLETRHIHRILYHWRASSTSTSIDHASKPYAHEAGRHALQRLLDAKSPTMRVEDTGLNYHYRLHIDIAEEPSVTILALAEREPGHLQSLKNATSYRNCSFHTLPRQSPGDRSTSPSEAHGMLTPQSAAALQELINGSSSDYLAILGQDTSELSLDWLTELVSKVHLEKSIAIACGRISYDGNDGPSYTVPDLGNQSVAYYASFLACASRHASGLHNLQYVNGCNFHICLIRNSDLAALGGFDFERYPRYLAMLDLCYRALEKGKKIIYTPDAVVTITGTRANDPIEDAEALQEKREFQQRHRLQLSGFDQWYNCGHLLTNGYRKKEFMHWLTGISA